MLKFEEINEEEGWSRGAANQWQDLEKVLGG